MKRTKKTPPQVFKKLLAHFGNQREIARALKIKQPSVQRWFSDQHIPIKRAIQIERITKGKITVLEMWPEIR